MSEFAKIISTAITLIAAFFIEDWLSKSFENSPPELSLIIATIAILLIAYIHREQIINLFTLINKKKDNCPAGA